MTNNGKIIANNNTLLIAQRIDGTGSITADGGKLDIRACSVLDSNGIVITSSVITKDLSLTNKAGTALNVAKPYSSAPPVSVEVKGNFLYSLYGTGKWNWESGTILKMSYSTPDHSSWGFLEAGGLDYRLRTLNIAGDIALVDLYNNTPGSGPEALYVDQLIFGGSTLNLNGCELFVNNGSGGWTEVNEGYLGKVVDYHVQSPVPVPPTVWLLGSGLLGLVGWRRFKRG